VTGAIFGLIGVVVGGLLTWAAQLFQDWRSERNVSLAAARMLSAELSVQQEALSRAAEMTAKRVSDDMPAIEDWPKYRDVMAKALDNEAWTAVAATYANLVLWHWESRVTHESLDETRETMRELAGQAEAARGSLQSFRRVRPTQARNFPSSSRIQ
jgi:hypothetical protein